MFKGVRARDGIYGSFKGAGSLGAVPLKEPFKKLAHLYIFIFLNQGRAQSVRGAGAEIL